MLLTVAKHDLVIGHALALKEAEVKEQPAAATADGDAPSSKEEAARVEQRESAARVLRACEEGCRQAVDPLATAAVRHRELFAAEEVAAMPALEAASRGLL